MNPLLSTLVGKLHSADVKERDEAIGDLAFLWEWQVLGRRDSAELIRDAALAAAKFSRAELEAALQEVVRIAASDQEDMRMRLTALWAIRITGDFRCVEIGARLLISSGDDLTDQEATEILFYIGPFFGAQRADQIRSLPNLSDLKKALREFQQRKHERLVEAATRLLNGLP